MHWHFVLAQKKNTFQIDSLETKSSFFISWIEKSEKNLELIRIIENQLKFIHLCGCQTITFPLDALINLILIFHISIPKNQRNDKIYSLNVPTKSTDQIIMMISVYYTLCSFFSVLKSHSNIPHNIFNGNCHKIHWMK